MSTKSKKLLSVVGLGYVGLPLAVEFAKNREVIAFDINADRVKQLKGFNDVTGECSDKEIKAAKKIKFTNNDADLDEPEIYIVTVPTPIDKSNNPDLNAIKSASSLVGSYLKKGNIVIFESTVFPGLTEEVCVPILESISGLKFNLDFFCGYSPERINPGDKVHTLTKITKITSGSNPETALEVDALYAEIITAGTHLASSIRVAESAKVIENCQRDLNIAFVNELSKIFQLMNIDTKEVLEASETKWNFLPFKPGMVGGHCIGVDPFYLTYKAEELGYNPEIILAGRRINDSMAKHAGISIIQKMSKSNIKISDSRLGILGFTFKENCPDIRNTKVIDLINEFQDWGINPIIVDPWANSAETNQIYDINLSDSKELVDLDAIVVAVPHNEFNNLRLEELREKCRVSNPVLADLKGIYNKDDAESLGFNYFRL